MTTETNTTDVNDTAEQPYQQAAQHLREARTALAAVSDKDLGDHILLFLFGLLEEGLTVQYEGESARHRSEGQDEG